MGCSALTSGFFFNAYSLFISYVVNDYNWDISSISLTASFLNLVFLRIRHCASNVDLISYKSILSFFWRLFQISCRQEDVRNVAASSFSSKMSNSSRSNASGVMFGWTVLITSVKRIPAWSLKSQFIRQCIRSSSPGKSQRLQVGEVFRLNLFSLWLVTNRQCNNLNILYNNNNVLLNLCW